MSLIFIKFFHYDYHVSKSTRILYFLIPLGILFVIWYDHYYNFFEHNKTFLNWIGLAVFIFSIYIYLNTRERHYPHLVYRTSEHIIWAICIIYAILFIDTKYWWAKLSLLKLILFTGLLLSIVTIPINNSKK